jgi:hemerythrin-like domain-containing protein
MGARRAERHALGMQRDRRLHGLSSEHHQALVLARRLAAQVASGTAGPDVALALAERFDAELEPHFRVEEALLLPALRAAGQETLAARTESDHARLRALVADARAGRLDALGPFAESLAEHVRFEERALFPACEATLGTGVLEQVERRAPKRP